MPCDFRRECLPLPAPPPEGASLARFARLALLLLTLLEVLGPQSRFGDKLLYFELD